MSISWGWNLQHPDIQKKLSPIPHEAPFKPNFLAINNTTWVDIQKTFLNILKFCIIYTHDMGIILFQGV